MKGVKVSYRVEGLNQDRLIESLKKHDIALYNVKKINNKLMYISVNLNQSKNFFAITKELCYNIKKVRYFGKGFPFYSLLKNVGLIVGAICFTVIAILSNDYIFDINFSGSGSVCQREVKEYLASQGVVERSRFSSFSIEKLEDGILASNSHLTFASVQKKGNTLDVYLVLKETKPQTTTKVTELKSTVNGVVEKIKVYRGRALFLEGDTVSVGDVLVDGQVQVKEQTLFLNVLACVTVRVEEEFIYISNNPNEKELAIVYALENLNGKEAVDTVVLLEEIVSGTEMQYRYVVKTYYLCQLYAG